MDESILFLNGAPAASFEFMPHIQTMQATGIEALVVNSSNLWQSIIHSRAHVQQKVHEGQLKDGLEILLQGVDLADIAVNFDNRPIRQLDVFRLIPIIGTTVTSRSLEPAQDRISLPVGVISNYRNGTRYGLPFLDAHQAIGLVFKDKLQAVSSAGIDKKDRLKIVQIQDVTGIKKYANPKEYYKTGLQQGILWRDTLAKAWGKIAGQLGIDQTVIQSNKNNKWSKKWNAHIECYDEVAVRLDYRLERGKKANWVKDL